MVTIPGALLSSFSTPGELEHLLKTGHVTRIFVEYDLLPIAFKAAKAVGIPFDSIYLLYGDDSNGMTSIESLLRDTETLPALAKPYSATKDTLAFLPFSSGTSSGFPKGEEL